MFERLNALMDELFDEDREDFHMVEDITSRIEEVDQEEWSEVYNSVGDLGKEAMDEAANSFADSAIGDRSWREGTDFED